MVQVRLKEQQAEWLAHIFDDAVRVPGTRLRFGLDPVIGMIPVVGDAAMVVAGTFILLIARQLRVPKAVLFEMAYNTVLNGMLGAVPILGDLYSFGFKSHAKNSALLVRTLKHSSGDACPLVVPPPTLLDFGVIIALTGPIAAAVAYLSVWMWRHDISVTSLLFMR
ncbi:DUF4112 domain-containing protein [Candidatus Nitrospira bockiana]